MRPGSSTSFIREKPVILLPEPDSPTKPNISPCRNCSDTPSTALMMPSRVWNQVLRPCTSNKREEVAVVMSRRSEEHTSELQSLMRISYAVFCLKKKKTQQRIQTDLSDNKQTHQESDTNNK